MKDEGVFGEAVERTKISLIRESEREREKRNFLDIERIGWLIGGVFSPTGCGLRNCLFFFDCRLVVFSSLYFHTKNSTGKEKGAF